MTLELDLGKQSILGGEEEWRVCRQRKEREQWHDWHDLDERRGSKGQAAQCSKSREPLVLCVCWVGRDAETNKNSFQVLLKAMEKQVTLLKERLPSSP